MYIVEVFEALIPSRKSTSTLISRISGFLALGTISRLFIYHGSLIPRANEKTFWKCGSIIVVSPMQLVFPYLSIEVDTYSSFTSYPHKTVNGQIMSDAFRDNTEIPKNEKFFGSSGINVGRK